MFIVMNSNNFNGKAGKFVKTRTLLGKESIELNSFIPEELPEIKTFGGDIPLMEKSNQANNALGELKGLTRNIGHPNLFIRPQIRKEAVDSSEIEGTFVSLTDVFLSEAGSKKRESANPDVREVVNFVKAIDYSIEELKNSRNIDKRLLNTMHKILLEDSRGKERTTGEFRQVQNWIRIKGTIRDPDFVPPPESEVERLMDYLFNYVNGSNEFMRLIKAGLIHYYFETIHPYEDGNGRVGRTLILLYLIKSGVLEQPVLHISPYFKKYREAYYNLLMEVRQTGNYNEWIKFFLDGITETAINTSKKVRKLIDLYADYKKKLSDVHATPLSFSLLDVFFESPYWSIPATQAKLNVKDYQKAKRGMKYLMRANIVNELTGNKKNQFFVASEILKILEEDVV